MREAYLERKNAILDRGVHVNCERGQKGNNSVAGMIRNRSFAVAAQ